MPKMLVTSILVLAISSSATIVRPDNSEEKSGGLSPENVDICGQLAVCVVSEYVTGLDFTEAVFEALPATGGMRSLDDLRQTLQKIGLHTVAMRWPRDQMPRLQVPAIVRIEGRQKRGHFIVLLRSAGEYVQVIDLPRRPSWIHREKLWETWDGVALHIASAPAQLPAPAHGALKLTASLTSCCLGLVVLWIAAAKGVRRGTLLSQGKMRWVAGSAVVAASVLWFGLMRAGIGVESGNAGGRNLTIIEPSSGRIEVAADQQDNPTYNVMGSFRIMNRGKERLPIEEVASSCSCSSPSLNTSVLDPGDEAILSVRVYPARSRSKSFTINLLIGGASRNMFEIPCTIIPKP